MIDFDTFTKNPYECEKFGQIKCCQQHLKVAQSPINRQTWSHWLLVPRMFEIHLRHKGGWVAKKTAQTCKL